MRLLFLVGISLLLLPLQHVYSKEAEEIILFPVDVLIDVGHGGVDGGTFTGEILEKDINLQIAQRLYDELSKKGYSVVLNRDKDYALSDDNHWLNTSSRHRKDLAQRTHLANALQPRIMISIHANFSSSAARHGANVLYQKSYLSRNLALFIQNALNNATGTRISSAPGAPYYILNHSDVPTVIVETGFLSNTKERKLLLSNRYQKKLSRAIADGIERYFILMQ